MGKRLADMTPAERKAAISRAMAALQAELQASAPEISRIMSEYDQPDPDRIFLPYKNAAQRRQNAIGMISELYLPHISGEPLYLMRVTDTREIAGNIRKISQLGRTERWHASVERWARMVEDSACDDPCHIRWAFLQGMIYASHASE